MGVGPKISVLSFLICANVSVLYAKQVELQKVFHHISGAQDHQCRADAIVFYVSSTVTPRLIRDVYITPTIRQRVYKLPAATCDTNVSARFPCKSSAGYSMKLMSKRSDIELVIEYDPARIVLAVSSFEAVKQQKAFAFHFLDQTYRPNPIHRAGAHRIVVVDCGHGGDDRGAIGKSGLCEKEVTLAVGTLLKTALEMMGIKVLMTRSTDATRALDERTLMANQCAADLVISLHANYAARGSVRGIETYSLSKQVHGLKSISDPEGLSCLRTCINARVACGACAASIIHKELCSCVTPYDPDTVNRGAKQAIAQLLLGTQASAVLIEMGFVSNPEEEALLALPAYQRVMVEGICRGVQRYFDLLNSGLQ